MQILNFKSTVFGLIFLVSSAMVMADEVDALREKANAQRKLAAELLEKGQKEEAAKLESVSQELLEKARLQEAGRRDVEPKSKDADPRHNADFRRLKERLAELIAAQQKLKESGNDQEFNEIREQIAQTEKHLTHLASSKSDPDRNKEIPKEFRAQVEKLEVAARRIHHIRVAAENLKAAEVHDLAEELIQRANAFEKEVHAARVALAEQVQAGQKVQGKESKGEISELQSENQKLRAELNELREVVEQLKTQSERK